jgi:hypothetical protein
MNALIPCRFQFDLSDGPVFDGFALGSTWNGFDNIAVTRETLDKIIAWAISDAGDSPLCQQSARDDFAIVPSDNGLYSLANGYCTVIMEGV